MNMKLLGRVVKGKQLGRTIGFPTANCKLVAPTSVHQGVYAVYIYYNNERYIGMMNIGTCPTITSQGAQTIEVHLLHFEGNLYGELLEIEIVHFMREELKFPSLNALVRQLKRDAAFATALLIGTKVEVM